MDKKTTLAHHNIVQTHNTELTSFLFLLAWFLENYIKITKCYLLHEATKFKVFNSASIYTGVFNCPLITIKYSSIVQCRGMMSKELITLSLILCCIKPLIQSFLYCTVCMYHHLYYYDLSFSDFSELQYVK